MDKITIKNAMTQTAKHTPGPWSETGGANYEIIAAHPRFGHTVTICIMADDNDAQLPDAHLIAAAPDLLAALKGAEQIIAVCDGDWEKPLIQIRAAIAKAEGK